MHDTSVKILSLAHTALFRLTAGIVGSRLVHNDMLLLTTKGRNTGRHHTVPLLYLKDGDDLIVIASYGGREHHPDWYTNLVHNGDAMIQIGGTHINVTATTLPSEERESWWPRIVEAYADYDVYQSRTEREIPVVRLSVAQ